jgi:hypothetical protein
MVLDAVLDAVRPLKVLVLEVLEEPAGMACVKLAVKATVGR